jgi:hypothetical protein
VSTPDYTLIPLDPAEQGDHGVQPSRRLNPLEQLQVSIWVVEGLANARIIELMAAHGMPSIGPSALTKYRHDEQLLEAAKRYLRREVMTVALAEKAVRVRKLQRHAEKLEALMDELGLVVTTTKVTGYDRSAGGALTTEEQQFANTLSKEWRDTLKQIREEVEPIEALLVPVNQTNNNTTVIFHGLSAADQEQFIEAMRWVPAVMPRALPPATAATIAPDEATDEGAA